MADLRCEVLIIGGGVVGLALARALSLRGRDVALVELQSRCGMATSSRHSEVIHAGIYYPTGSLKAETCIEGRRALYGYLDSHAIQYQKISKLIFASQPSEVATLEALYRQGIRNGVEGLSVVGGVELRDLEPELKAERAILSEETGIFDSHAYLRALEADAREAGAQIAVGTSFECAMRDDAEWNVSLNTSGQRTTVTARWLVNCAGHGAHAVATTIEGYPSEVLPPRFLARGAYWATTQKVPFKRLLYPMPSEAGLGIHLTFDLAGAARFGPDVEWVGKEDYAVDPTRRAHFEDAIRRYFPGLETERLRPDYAGIRPKIVGPDEPNADFMLQGFEDHGVEKLLNLFGLESPGLTASLALADRVALRMH